jgi:hypothetical protein
MPKVLEEVSVLPSTRCSRSRNIVYRRFYPTVSTEPNRVPDTSDVATKSAAYETVQSM